MTGVGVSWSAPAWVGQSDKDYSDLLRRKPRQSQGATKGVVANTASKKR